MLRYIIKRIAIAVPVLIVVVLIIFWMLNVLPGNPISIMMGEKASEAVIQRVTQEMGLNDPWPLRFARYVLNAAQGDFGRSYKLNRQVTDLIAESFPNTVKLAVSAALVAWLIGIPAGIVSAIKKNSLVDHAFMGFALFGISMPVFWAAMLMQWVFGFKLNVLPISGYGTLAHMVMPAIVLGWASSGSIARMTRSNLLEVMRNDYIRTARAKGLKESLVVYRHALKNSMMPVVTMMAIQFAGLLSGAVITENVFNIGGIGRLTVDAINKRDMPLLQGAVLFSTVLIILGNLIADIMYSFLDPRIRV
ncbi:MAG: glutathione ABC transporter permease GsiC [Clostridium sp. SCN 57-10]|nr:MAG: glutathione ABC transporter permease GsiC [Clostridium sp. SCN 57-10]